MAPNKKESTAMTLSDLPEQVLLDILEKVNWNAYRHLHSLSDRMRGAVEAHVLSQCKLTTRMRLQLHEEEGIALNVIKTAAEPFIETGFTSNFAGCFLKYNVRKAVGDPFKLGLMDIVPFLQKFFDSIPSVRAQSTPQDRLLLNLAMLRLLGSYEDKEVLVSCLSTRQWRLALEIRGPWLGWLNKKRCLTPQKQSGLVLVLAKLLYLNVARLVFKHMMQRQSEVFVYGHDQPHGDGPMPVTRFSIQVNGRNTICSFLKSCFETGQNPMCWPETFPSDKFQITMEVYCPRAKHHGCAESMLVAAKPMLVKEVWAYRGEKVQTNNKKPSSHQN